MKIVHASISENNTSGWDGKAKAGDQTGREVCIRDYYNKPWGYIIRCRDKILLHYTLLTAIRLALSGLVGYDQSERNTLYQGLAKWDFDVDSYIKSGQKTECDCSSFIYACFACFIPEIRSNINAPTTRTMRGKFAAWGFEIIPFDFTKIRNGDVLLAEGSHTVMIID